MQERILLRSIPSKRYMIVLKPRMTAKYEGRTELGEYIEFKDGYAEVTPDQLEQLSQLPDFGVDYVVVNEIKPIENEMQIRAEMMPSEKQKNGEVGRIEAVESEIREIKSDINLIAKSIADLAQTVTQKKSKKKKEEKES